MNERTIAALVVFVTLALASPAQAGGWATVTLDEVPDAPRAGEALEIGFTIRQHGREPVDVHTFGGEMPLLQARHTESGETVEFVARKEGPEGHYVVTAAFPRAGDWAWEITAAPFAGTRFEPLTVVEAGAARTGAVEGLAALPLRQAMALSGAALLVIAAGLAVYSRLRAPGQRRLEPAR
ncbi:MAG: hypothetical protein DIU80_024710 [Chloroflexota bacterium]|nr:MAG: hypothetical protein DIU80_16475 [Chloroflexota bacterium]